MNSVFRSLVVGVLVLCMATWTVPVKAAIVDQISVPISISATIGSIGTYSLSATTSGSMAFDTSTVSTSDPWRVINGYVDIDLSVTGNTTWGLRMVTDNVADLTGLSRDSTTGNLVDTGGSVVTADASGGYTDGISYFAGFDTTGTGTYSYSGLINTAAMDDSSMRAAFAWQVDGYDTSGTATGATIPTSAPTVDGSHGDSSSVGDWNDPWIYMVDKSNSDYGDNGWNTATGGKVSEVDSTTGLTEFNYTLIAYGSVSGGYLALKDTARPLSGTEGSTTDPWDIYVYLVGKFMNTDWSTATDFVLPAGSYNTNLYLELFTE